MGTKRSLERIKAEKEAVAFGKQTIDAITKGNAERAGALATFAIRWAKRSLGSIR